MRVTKPLRTSPICPLNPSGIALLERVYQHSSNCTCYENLSFKTKTHATTVLPLGGALCSSSRMFHVMTFTSVVTAKTSRRSMKNSRTRLNTFRTKLLSPRSMLTARADPWVSSMRWAASRVCDSHVYVLARLKHPSVTLALKWFDADGNFAGDYEGGRELEDMVK